MRLISQHNLTWNSLQYAVGTGWREKVRNIFVWYSRTEAWLNISQENLVIEDTEAKIILLASASNMPSKWKSFCIVEDEWFAGKFVELKPTRMKFRSILHLATSHCWCTNAVAEWAAGSRATLCMASLAAVRPAARHKNKGHEEPIDKQSSSLAVAIVGSGRTFTNQDCDLLLLMPVSVLILAYDSLNAMCPAVQQAFRFSAVRGSK